MTIKTTWILLAAGLMACGGSSQPAATTTPAPLPADSEAAPADNAAATPAEPAAAEQTPTEWKEAGWNEGDPAPAEQPTAADPDQAQRCRDATPHVVALVRTGFEEMMAGMPPDQQAKAREEMDRELSEEKLLAECLKSPFTPAQFDCIMASGTLQDLMKCEKAE